MPAGHTLLYDRERVVDRINALGELFPRSLDLVVHDFARFCEGLGRGWERHRYGQSHPILIV